MYSLNKIVGCPYNCQLIDSLCYCECPEYTVPANEDPSKCVPSEPCEATVSSSAYTSIPLTTDLVFSLTCNKVGFPKSGSCANNYTEWRAGYCYINCPPGMLESGLTCIRRTLQRPYVEPSTDLGLLTYPLFLFLLLSMILAFMYYFYGCKRS